MRLLICVCLFLLSVCTVSARELAGVDVAERVFGQNGKELRLNGAGIRSKLFFKIYIGALYLENPGSDPGKILADDKQRMMIMHILYDEVDREKLVSAWNDGFSANLTEAEKAVLIPQITKFNDMFTTVKKGDTIVLAYTPDNGTLVEVAGEQRGVIEGKPFADALFAIWLGDKPVTSDLKSALLNPHM